MTPADVTEGRPQSPPCLLTRLGLVLQWKGGCFLEHSPSPQSPWSPWGRESLRDVTRLWKQGHRMREPTQAGRRNKILQFLSDFSS